MSNEDSHLLHFWKLVTFRKHPKTVADINTMVQVEMMKYNTCAVICKLAPNDYEKCMTSLFVGEPNYFCHKSKFLIKNPEITDIIDLIVSANLNWEIKSNLEGISYIEVSWKHW